MAIKIIPELTESDKERFWSRVNKNGPVVREGLSPCWIWDEAFRRKNGYGNFCFLYSAFLSHRVSWALHNGEIPYGLFVCHKCDNHACVNPAHLFLGTHTQNLEDMKAKGRSLKGRKKIHSSHLKGDAHPARRIPGWRAGSRNGRSVITEFEIPHIRAMIATGKSVRKIAEIYGVGDNVIQKIRTSRTWKHVP